MAMTEELILESLIFLLETAKRTGDNHAHVRADQLMEKVKEAHVFHLPEPEVEDAQSMAHPQQRNADTGRFEHEAKPEGPSMEEANAE
jgi:hypothetical protein